MPQLRSLVILGVLGLSLFACNGQDPISASTNPVVTTDRVPATTLTTVPAPLPRVVGLVGCSMTIDAAVGYRRQGGGSFWSTPGLGYGGGSVARWSDPEDKRGLRESFAAALESEPETDTIWWQLCTSGSDEDNFDNALVVLAELETLVPEAEIFVSAQPDYLGDHVCESAGPGGPARMARLADELVATGRVSEGPSLSPLAATELVDTCHAGDVAVDQMGSELLAFFDEDPPPSP